MSFSDAAHYGDLSGKTELHRQRDAALAEWSTLAAQVEQAIRWSIDEGAEPMVAIHALRRYLAENPPPREMAALALHTDVPEENG